jgi:CRP-like cAMP-binding protein
MNLLLARLSAAGFERLRGELEPVALAPGTVVYEPGVAEENLYFISGGVVSLVEVTASGAATEIAQVGKEGVLGIDLFMGGKTAPWRMVARSPGEAFRLNADALAWQFARNVELRGLLLRFTQALMAQIAQTAVCNRHHSIEQQLCRWLLAVLDRLGLRELVITQQEVAAALGVRREGISAAAARLQKDGVIRYSRGRIRMLERAGIELRVCECYGEVRQAYERLLAAPPR